MNEVQDGIDWPAKTRELSHSHVDSTIWNDFEFRDDDIVIGTYGKCGTTWLQQIVSQLIFDGAEGLPVARISPWLDTRLAPREEVAEALHAQTHRRFLKTHLPVDALVYSPKAKYIYAARDGRDVVWSYYNHHSNHTETFYEAIRQVKGPDDEAFAPPTEGIVEYFRTWLEKDGYPLWSFWENIGGWWHYRDLPNLLLVHFEELKADLPGQIRRVAGFLDIRIDESHWDTIVEHCSFDYMKAHAEDAVPAAEAVWKGGAKTFIHKGTNGRWRDMLRARDNERYEATAIEKLGADCAHWLATGQMP